MGNPCEDPLINELIAILRKTGQKKFNKAVEEEASRQLDMEEVKQAIQEYLEKFFDRQIATLKDRGTPEQIVELLAKQRDSVTSKARVSEMTFKDGHIPFLPVIPRTYRSPYDLMAMVKHDDKKGYNYIKPTDITDTVETPDEPYYIFDVEDGESTKGISPETAIKIFKSKKRSALTAAEVMALTTHTDVLSRHNMWASGSRCNSAVFVPGVCLNNGMPGFSWSCADLSPLEWGSPSLGSR